MMTSALLILQTAVNGGYVAASLEYPQIEWEPSDPGSWFRQSTNPWARSLSATPSLHGYAGDRQRVARGGSLTNSCAEANGARDG